MDAGNKTFTTFRNVNELNIFVLEPGMHNIVKYMLADSSAHLLSVNKFGAASSSSEFKDIFGADACKFLSKDVIFDENEWVEKTLTT